MKSQVAHTDMMRYSSKIPAPVESVRYFAPNTCSPVNARETALSYSSDERSEADSGIEYMSRPSQKLAVTGSRNAVKRTSFNDERSVRAYNSEVHANIVSTKGSSAAMGAAKLDSSGSMGQRDQVASEARPRRSRSAGRASSSVKRAVSSDSPSPSRHVVQAGDRNTRATMRCDRPSRGRKKSHGRASSSESSTSDSDNDESPFMRPKHVMRPPKFDGRSSFESFWAQFQNCVTYNQWSQVEQLAFLKHALVGDAANVLWDYGLEVTESLSRLSRMLKMRFGGENFAEKNRIALKNRRRLPGESLTDLHIDIRRLSTLAYPDTDHKTREVISCDYFIDALANPELALKIRERQPTDLDAALHIALQLEVWTQDSARLSQSMEQTSVDSNMVHEISQSRKGGRSMTDLKVEMDEQRKLIAEQTKLVASCQQMLETMNVYLQSVASSTTGSGMGQRPHALVCCQCSQLGHVASYCPTVVRQNKEVVTDKNMLAVVLHWHQTYRP